LILEIGFLFLKVLAVLRTFLTDDRSIVPLLAPAGLFALPYSSRLK